MAITTHPDRVILLPWPMLAGHPLWRWRTTLGAGRLTSPLKLTASIANSRLARGSRAARSLDELQGDPGLRLPPRGGAPDAAPTGRGLAPAGQPEGTGGADAAAEGHLARGGQGPMSGRFAWLRVWPGHGWATGDYAGEGPSWLLLEEQATASSSTPSATCRRTPAGSGPPACGGAAGRWSMATNR